jgi:7-keto-8-aminopelargonate synthetase-like enzyme
LAEELVEIEKQGLLRVCRERPAGMFSFASNDYQNLAEDPRLKEAACAAIQRHGAGSGASRLVTGTLPEHVRLERHLASFKGTEDAVVWAIENGTSKEMSATGFSLNLNSSCGWFVTFN